ncbi:hypothetical protein BZA77DRAFT_365224 [Pyronema omphalodes]|nr:hypothetical protein BZA77DRAFT_365224 [Pyronema omphalodes]
MLSLFVVGKKRKNRAESTSAESETNTRQQVSPEQPTPPETIATNRRLLRFSATKTLGTLVDKQLALTIDDNDSSPSQPKRKMRDTKINEQQLAAALLPSSKTAISLSACPTDVLDKIIRFLRGPLTAGVHDDLLNLRLNVFYFESRPEKAMPVLWSLKDLEHDYKIYAEFDQIMEPKTATGKTFNQPPNPLQLRNTLDVYDQMCVPLLLSRLNNLRFLDIQCYGGGVYSSLLTPWAQKIWEHMPLKSLEILSWQLLRADEDRQRMLWPAHDTYHSQSAITLEKPSNNDWNLLGFLPFAPGLQKLTIIDDMFLARATPCILPTMPFLTSICIDGGHPKGTMQCILKLLHCSPSLKHLRASNWKAFPASTFRKALRLVRNTIEDIDISGTFNGISSTHGGIGPFQDFLKLKRISANLAALAPLSPAGWPEAFSLFELLPPNLESFHLHITDTDVARFKSQLKHQQVPVKYQRFSELLGRLYELLENVALAKKSGELTRLCSIRLQNPCCRYSRTGDSSDGSNRLAAICAALGIEWKCRVNDSSVTETESAMDTDTDPDTEIDTYLDTDTDAHSEWDTDWVEDWSPHGIRCIHDSLEMQLSRLF